jgi:acylpyruvate hydrolase
MSRCSYWHYKVELGLVIGQGGRDISEANAEEHIAGYGAYTKLRLRY